MAHKCRAQALSLTSVGYSESDFCLPWLDDDVASAADDYRSFTFFRHCDQGHMADKVYINEKGNFLLRKAALWRKETSAEGCLAASADGFGKCTPVVGSQRADFEAASVAQRL